MSAPPQIILPLSSPDATLGRAGGKGANLSALVRAGFAVPPGFILTTDAYRYFVEANGIRPRLLEIARAVMPDDASSLPRAATASRAGATMEDASEEIRSLFVHGAMPVWMKEELGAAYGALARVDGRETPVAVRSSATAEDLPGLSFAGQQDTYLNVIGSAALIEAVKACWGSLWTARAMNYRARNAIASQDLALAVLVQVLIPSEVSGVLFTANPVTGHRGEMVIEASFGLGEGIVSGQVEADHYVVNHRERRITARKLGAKALSILPRKEGGTQAVPREVVPGQALTDAQILDLTTLAGRVADYFGSPQDVEWAYEGGHVYLLQSRPITSLYPVPRSLLESTDLRVLISLNSLQGVVEPFTPLARDLFPMLFSGPLRAVGVRRPLRDIVIAAGGRVYLDVTVPLKDGRLRRLVLAMLANADPGAREAVRGLIASGRIPSEELVSVGGVLRFMFGLRPVIAGIPLTWLRPEARRESAIRGADRYLARVRAALAEASSLESRLAVIDQYVPHMLREVLLRTLAPVMVPGLLAQAIAGRWLTAWAGAAPEAVRRLLRGLPGNPTTEMDLRLWAVARLIQCDPAAKLLFESQTAEGVAAAYARRQLPRRAQEALEMFLTAYGMRAVGEIDIGRPRWREDPRSIIQSVHSFLKVDDPSLGPDRLFQAAAAQAEQLSAEYVASAKARQGALRARLLAMAIRRMRLLVGLREMPKFYIIKLLDLLRGALLESGSALVAQGNLSSPEDIFFVPLDVLQGVAKGEPADLKGIVGRERREYDRELSRRQIPRLLLSTGEVFYQGLGEAGEGNLVGDGVSPGVVEGRVRVVFDPRGALLRPGEILVCPATDPGWTPLFLAAGGLVMELGGMMTHGSVVAREYGIPAVVGVHEATQRLKTGQIVRVDGSAGRVVVLEHREED